MAEEVRLPKWCEQKHLEFLDELREDGITNMYGAVPYLIKEYPELDDTTAGKILSYWMMTFPKRHKGETR